MAKEQRLIDGMRLVTKLSKRVRFGRIEYDDVLAVIAEAPTVDAVKLPKGKPGDYVKWTNGVSERLFEISSIVICKDGMRYDLGDFCPFVNHPNILEIMSREEAERGMQDG